MRWTAQAEATGRAHAQQDRPVTLFTGQWADLPFREVCRLASEWGYDGLEIACWGDHFDVAGRQRTRRTSPSAATSWPSTGSVAGRSPTT